MLTCALSDKKLSDVQMQQNWSKTSLDPDLLLISGRIHERQM